MVKINGTDDWYFEYTNWALDTGVYHGSPSSLRTENANWFTILNKDPNLVNLSQGRVETWFYVGGVSYSRTFGIAFRAQATPPDYANLYYWYMDTVSPCFNHLGVLVAGALTDFTSDSIAAPGATTWVHYRVTWWEKYGNLYMRAEQESGGSWSMTTEYMDSNNRWSASSINRCGLRVQSHATIDKVWIDDTTIYAPT